MTVQTAQKKGEKENSKQKQTETFLASIQVALKRTGILISTDNSLNQHVKNKHPDYWKKMRFSDIGNNENIYEEEKEEKADDIFEIHEDEYNNDNQNIDFNCIVENF